MIFKKGKGILKSDFVKNKITRKTIGLELSDKLQHIINILKRPNDSKNAKYKAGNSYITKFSRRFLCAH